MADDLNFDFEAQLNARDAVDREVTKVREKVHDVNMANLATANGSAPRHGKSNFRQIVCRHWLRGLCMKGDECTFLHQAIPERMPICQYFSRFGECHQPDCPFKHNEEEVKECYMYKLGWCINGPYCRYRHVKLPGPPPSILETIKLKLPSGGGGQPVVHHRVVARDGGGWTTSDRQERPRGHRPPPPSYVCHLCRVPGHWKQQCPTLQENGGSGVPNDRPLKRPRSEGGYKRQGGYAPQQAAAAAAATFAAAPPAPQQPTQLGGWGRPAIGMQAPAMAPPAMAPPAMAPPAMAPPVMAPPAMAPPRMAAPGMAPPQQGWQQQGYQQQGWQR